MTSRTTQGTPPRRLLAPDAARGFMLLLIAMAYAGAYVMDGFGTDASHDSFLDRAASFATTMLLDNRAFPMFALLFGYGVAWSISRRTERGIDVADTRRRTRRRALFLLLFGLVHAILVFPGEILSSYGIALLLTGWLLLRSDRALTIALALTGMFYLVLVPLTMLVASAAPEEGFAVALPGYTTALDWIERVVGAPIGPLYVAIGYPLLFLVILGYVAGRARLFEKTESRRGLLRAVAFGGIAISLLGALPSALALIGVLEVDPVVTGLFMGLQVLTGVAGGAGYAAFFALGSGHMDRLAPALTRAVAAIGQRSLTFYIFNSVVVALVLHPDLIGVGEYVGHFGALLVAAAAWLLALVIAAWMDRRGLPGPLEQLMRRGVDGRASLSAS